MVRIILTHTGDGTGRETCSGLYGESCLVHTSLPKWETGYLILIPSESKVNPHKAYFQRLNPFRNTVYFPSKVFNLYCSFFFLSLYSLLSFKERISVFYFFLILCKLTPGSIILVGWHKMRAGGGCGVYSFQAGILCWELSTEVFTVADGSI